MTKRVWTVLPDPFPTRVFVDCGIVSGLAERLPDRVEAILVLPPREVAVWAERLGDVPWSHGAELFPSRSGRWSAAFDESTSPSTGTPATTRCLYGTVSAMASTASGCGRSIRTCSSTPRAGRRLPGSETVDGALRGWLYSKRRYVSSELLERMRAECSLVVLANVQSHPAVPFLGAARRLDIPVVGYVASWDHTVGKGLVSPHVTRYVVQNEVMRDDLVQYHDVDPQRVTVTGWPQTDVFEPRRPLGEYEAILAQLDLVPGVPVVLVAGNTPTNAPYEGRFVERLVEWWRTSGVGGRLQLLFRPHPRDVDWRERYSAALACPVSRSRSRRTRTSRRLRRCSSMWIASSQMRERSSWTAS